MIDAMPKPTLRPYQEEAVYQIVEDSIHNNHGTILADEMGLGKTPTFLVASRKLSPYGAILVITRNASVGNLVEEIRTWLDEVPILWLGTPVQRGCNFEAYVRTCYRVNDYWLNHKPDDPTDDPPGSNYPDSPTKYPILVTNYALAAKLPLKDFKVIVLDEAHELRNRQSKIYKAIRKLRAKSIIPATGSPVVNGVQDLFTLLQLVAPKQFSSFWKFIKDNFYQPNIDAGDYSFTTLKDSTATRTAISPYIIRRYKKDHLQDLPPKTRERIPLVMTPYQAKLYAQISESMIGELGNGELILTPNQMTVITRLRQLLVTPALIHGENSSAALNALKDLLEADMYASSPIVIFTPFTEAIPYIEEAVESTGFVDEVYHLRGGMTPSRLQQNLSAFKSSSRRRVIVCSLLMATSFNELSVSPRAYFLGYHWTPTTNLQAEDRLHRSGQLNPVSIRYFVHKDTIDQHIIDVLTEKATWAALSLDPNNLVRPNAKPTPRKKIELVITNHAMPKV